MANKCRPVKHGFTLTNETLILRNVSVFRLIGSGAPPGRASAEGLRGNEAKWEQHHPTRRRTPAQGARWKAFCTGGQQRKFENPVPDYRRPEFRSVYDLLILARGSRKAALRTFTRRL